MSAQSLIRYGGEPPRHAFSRWGVPEHFVSQWSAPGLVHFSRSPKSIGQLFNTRAQECPVLNKISYRKRLTAGCARQVILHTCTLPLMRPKKASTGQLMMFPSPSREIIQQAESQQWPSVETSARVAEVLPRLAPVDVVLSGSYRKDFARLKTTYEELRDLGCNVLSPSNVTAVKEVDGFVYMKGEEIQAPDSIEERHLDAIQRSQFMWLHTPEGYVGRSASLEIGFAHAVGVPVFASEAPSDPVLAAFVRVVSSPQTVLERLHSPEWTIPQPPLKAFQHYYRRAAVQRGYQSESARDCLLLMVEEVGELAREVRKREKLVRHGRPSTSSEGAELADVFLYVVHLANTMDIDLSSVVQQKELVNLQRSLAR